MTIRLDNLSQLLFFATISKDCEYNYMFLIWVSEKKNSKAAFI